MLARELCFTATSTPALTSVRQLRPTSHGKAIVHSLVTAACLIPPYVAIVPFGFKLSNKELALYFLCSCSVSALHTDGGLPWFYLLVRQLFH